SRPHQESIATGVSHALLLHDATAHDVWEALTILEPPLAAAAARARTEADLEQLRASVAALATPSAAAAAVRHTVGAFRGLGQAPPSPVLRLAQEPLLQLLEPSLRVMIDKVPQARSRILTAHRRLLAALEARDAEEAQAWMTRHIRDFRRGYELAG